MTGRRLGARDVGDLPLDEELFERIVEDMRRHAGPSAPAEIWQPETLFPDAADEQRRPRFAALVAPWIGGSDQGAPLEKVPACRHFLDEVDPSGAARAVFDRWLEHGGADPSAAHLRTALEWGLIAGYAQDRPDPRLRVLEVGGGYGRLAEAALGIGPDDLTYVLLDAVPASLYYAHAYLTRAAPERRIGSFYRDEGADPAGFDAYVAPIWHARRLGLTGFDVAVNVASLQEMREDQVDACLALIDEALAVGGHAVLSNTRDYAYGHDYRYPATWELVLKRNTPLALSPHYPVEVLRRRAEAADGLTAEADAAYLAEVTAAYRAQRQEERDRFERQRKLLLDRIEGQARAIAERDAIIGGLRARLDEQRRSRLAAAARHEKTVARLKARLEKQRAVLADRDATIERLRARTHEQQRVLAERADRLAAVRAQARDQLAAARRKAEVRLDRLERRLAKSEEARQRRDETVQRLRERTRSQADVLRSAQEQVARLRDELREAHEARRRLEREKEPREPPVAGPDPGAVGPAQDPTAGSAR